MEEHESSFCFLIRFRCFEDSTTQQQHNGSNPSKIVIKVGRYLHELRIILSILLFS